MCEEAMCICPASFYVIPVHLKTKEMCIKAIEEHSWDLFDAPDHLYYKRRHLLTTICS